MELNSIYWNLNTWLTTCMIPFIPFRLAVVIAAVVGFARPFTPAVLTDSVVPGTAGVSKVGTGIAVAGRFGENTRVPSPW
jgi:hypothetical protein